MSTPAAKESMRTTMPMVGYTLRSGLVRSGETVSLKGWVKPIAEPEIAVHIGRDLDGDGR